MDLGRRLTGVVFALALAGAADAAPPAPPPKPPPRPIPAKPTAPAAARPKPAIPPASLARPHRHHHRRARTTTVDRDAGPSAIAEARRPATARSHAHPFDGGPPGFTNAPGPLYEVWTAPLRVTSLTLGPGESVVALAAGDTVRWQIGETASGEGAARRIHVMIKPLSARLETNLVLTTNQRLYFVALRSGPPATYNPAVAWSADALDPPRPPAPPPIPPATAPVAANPPAVAALDARFSITPRGRPPAWTPTAVMTDGARTLIAFPPDLGAGEAPALFAIAPDGQAQMINYRQQAGLFVVDRVLERAELRLGERRPQVVTIRHLAGGRP